MSGSQQLLLGGSVAVPVDPYFYSVTSLLHGDGTNGGQNNTFLDSSTNNFTITRNGNTTQGSFSPFSQTGWSVAGGNGDGFVITQTTNTDLGSGDFCVEAFVYLNSLGSNNTIITKRKSDGALAGSWILEINSAGNVNFGGVGSGTNITGTGPISVGQWTHVVGCRTGSTLSVFANGVRVGTTTATDNYSCSTNTFIKLHGNNGGEYPGGGALFGGVNGHINNLRVVVGSNPYSASSTTLTVPTGNLTAITNTKLLFAQSNRFVDNSSVGQTLSIYASPAIQPFSPFNPTTAYSTSAVGGSGYFDGAGDYLSWTGTAFGSGNFTAECWAYFTPYSTANYAIIGSAAANTSAGWELYLDGSASKINVYSGGVIISPSSTVTANQWYHLAFVRSGSTVTLYINGVSVGTATLTANLSNTTMYVSYDFAGQTIAGYVSGVRHVVGTAVYTAGFTPPTAPPTAITNTSALLNFTNGAIFDNAAVADYETVGNAQISTSVFKYGTGSLAFDGTGDYLVTPTDVRLMEFGSGDFTVEAWIYPANVSGSKGIADFRTSSSDTAGFYFGLNGSQIQIYSQGVINVSAGVIAANTWTHVACNRTAGVINLYVNGTQVSSTANTTSWTRTSMTVGAGYRSGNDPMNGYIDDLRVTKGVGRYPYSFTPPTAAFPNIGGTVTLTADPYFDYTTLLLPGNGTNGAQNNTFLDSSTNNFTITRNGNTTQGTFSPFSQTGWGNYFDGATATRLTMPSNAAFAFGTGAYTVEGWVYLNAQAATQSTFFEAGTASGAFSTSILSTGAVSLGTYGVGAIFSSPSNSVTPNQWFHIAIVRNSTASNDTKIYVNGTAVATGTDSSNWTVTTTPGIGGLGLSGYTLNGYISNLRVVKGTAVYTANFTPPTTPLTAITNTSLLTCQSNRFIDNSTNNFAITRNGDVSVQAFSPFNPTAAWSAATNGGSGYFDGSGDYLSGIGTTSSFNFMHNSTALWTFECWAYLPSPSTNQYILDNSDGTTTQIGVYIGIESSKLLFTITRGSTGTWVANGSSTDNVPANQWVHLAITYDQSLGSNNGKFYINGVASGTVNKTANAPSSSNASNAMRVGAFAAGSGPLTGYLSNLRISNSVVYSSAFTPPTSPVTGGSLLLNFTNAGIYDATSKNDLETVGNAQISTTQSKFGGSSMYFDGTGDWLTAAAGQWKEFGSGDFTIECWSYITDNSTRKYIIGAGVDTASHYNFALELGSSGKVNMWASSNGSTWDLVTSDTSEGVGTTTIPLNQWNHIAMTRYQGTFRSFLNGVLQCTVSGKSGAIVSQPTQPVNVGKSAYTGSFGNFNGYINDLRITKGIARYTSNFTPPSTAFLTL